MSDRLVGEDEWAADMLYGREPSLAPLTERRDVDDGVESASSPTESDARAGTVELDSTPPDESDPADVDAGAKRDRGRARRRRGVRRWGDRRCAVDLPRHRARTAVRIAAARVAPLPRRRRRRAAMRDADQAIPFTASANCPTGSTSAQALTDVASDSAWVCVRGDQGATVDGQVLHVDFGRSYVLSAVSVTPGWVAKTPGGKDEWLQHRVVSRLQYMFNDTERTIVTQDTGNTHGPVTTALPRKVMASAVTVVILQTSRPPASPLPTSEPDAFGAPGFGDSMLGTDGAPLSSDAVSTTEPLAPDNQDGDPVDATFAMSELKFLGHEPN